MPSQFIIQERAYHKKMKEWLKESQSAGKVWCRTCARSDYDNGRLASSWTNYEVTNLVNTSEIRDRTNTKVLGRMHNYLCHLGHGTSVEEVFPVDQFGRPIDESKLKKEVEKLEKKAKK